MAFWWLARSRSSSWKKASWLLNPWKVVVLEAEVVEVVSSASSSIKDNKIYRLSIIGMDEILPSEQSVNLRLSIIGMDEILPSEQSVNLRLSTI